jgi:hypothetical protein
MGIKSEPFRGVILSGDDAKRFTTQVRNLRPSNAAIATVARGIKMASELQQKGYVTSNQVTFSETIGNSGH